MALEPQSPDPLGAAFLAVVTAKLGVLNVTKTSLGLQTTTDLFHWRSGYKV